MLGTGINAATALNNASQFLSNRPTKAAPFCFVEIKRQNWGAMD
jgi:hypothetical protein